MRYRKKKNLPSFVPLSREMLKSKEWRVGLSSSAKVLYICIKHKYVGSNNGLIRLYYSEMSDVMAEGTIAHAFQELEERGWIERIKVGSGKYRWVYDIKLTGQYDKIIF